MDTKKRKWTFNIPPIFSNTIKCTEMNLTTVLQIIMKNVQYFVKTMPENVVKYPVRNSMS